MPGIVAGSQITLPSDGGTYALYYLFPMTEQQETLSLVRRALLTGGVLLLLLVGGLTWLVTRQVVTPVRLARRVAERLASGRLEERMHVRGDDDIARLGTSFNQMAASLQKQIRQLEELSRVQRRFVSDVSHELRTPLTTVRMAGDVLYDARERFDPVTARSAELLQKELDRFELLLTDLLEISRFDAGAAVLDLEDVNLVDLALRVAESTKALADRRGTRVVVHRPDQPCVAEVDVRRVERILRNLFTNAIDYADGHDVDVLLAANEDATALAVRDHGIGLAQGESAMVFNRFWRADPARARTTGGTGLGLSIALEDAHLHGGWLQAWGEPATAHSSGSRCPPGRRPDQPEPAVAGARRRDHGRGRRRLRPPGHPEGEDAVRTRATRLALLAALAPPARRVRQPAAVRGRPDPSGAGPGRADRRPVRVQPVRSAQGRVAARGRPGLPGRDGGVAALHRGGQGVPLRRGPRRLAARAGHRRLRVQRAHRVRAHGDRQPRGHHAARRARRVARGGRGGRRHQLRAAPGPRAGSGGSPTRPTR